MRSDGDRRPVAIIGGGFSGTMAAVQLSRRGIASLLIDGSGRAGRGVAYSTTEAVHLLNVPSGKMSAWPDQPQHFAHWGGDDGSHFAERRAFGAYLSEQLRSAEHVEIIAEAAVHAGADEGGWTIVTDGGRERRASALVLANGNQPPAPMSVGDGVPDDLFINNPWSDEARQAVQRVAGSDDSVLILGTGLTMIDTVLSLAAAGHEGGITALSRRGLIPRGHAPHTAAPVNASELPKGDLVSLWRWLRRRSGEVGFRAAVDSLRPHSRDLWQAWSGEQQRRFLRHARPWWDVHRHRIAPTVAEQLQGMIAQGQLSVVAGRAGAIVAEHDRLVATIAPRGGGPVRRQGFAAVFNCTGPLGDMARTQDPLIRGLLAQADVRIDDLGIGLEVDGASRAGERIWALGPLTKGRYWEMVAVPDIREQVAEVAVDIAQELTA